MSGEEASAEDRTEAATPRRLEQAREQGQLAVSRDLTMLAALGGGIAGTVVFGTTAARQLADSAASFMSAAGALRIEDGLIGRGPLGGVLLSAAMLVGVVALPGAIGAIASVLLQTNFYVGGAPVKLQFSRISPLAGFSRLFSWHHLLDFLKSCLRLGVLSLLMWTALRRLAPAAIPAIGIEPAWLLNIARAQVSDLVRPLLMALAGFAAVDLFLVRMQHNRQMRMTREQIRLESRDTDGDPHIKGKLHRIRQQRSRRRMMQKVKTADVVITNPTHYAVALSYDRGGSSAPRVVAKGADLVAARIREEAALHDIAIVPDPPLARALFTVELDREIPAEHYRAVAEVIAFVWKLKRRLAAPGLRP